MANMFVRVAFTAAVAAGLFVAVGTPTVAQEKGLTIKDIMKAGHGGTDALMKQAVIAAKDGKWDAAVAAAKSLDSNAALLEKATPGKGGADSWEKLAGAYHKNTSALLAAAEKKDAAGVGKAAGAIGGSCKACHTAHKGK